MKKITENNFNERNEMLLFLVLQNENIFTVGETSIWLNITKQEFVKW